MTEKVCGHRDCEYPAYDRAELCDHCRKGDCGCPRCIVCQHRALWRHERQTCTKCQERVRDNLDTIVELYALLPAELEARAYSTSQTDKIGGRSAETPSPGGDVLVMLAGGSDGRTDAQEDDPESVAWTLASWEDDWRRIRGHAAATGPATVVSAAAYLGVNLGWAANWHPAFPDYYNDLRRLRARLGEVTRTAQHAQRTTVPCFECGGTLVQKWTEQGLSDDRECEDCRRVYKPREFWFAVRAQMESDRRSG